MLISRRIFHPRLTATEREAVHAELLNEGEEYRPYVVRVAILMGLSAVIAALGMIADSSATVIGAMLVAPLMTPLMELAAALVGGWPRRQAVALLLVCGAAVEAFGLAWLTAEVVPSFRALIVTDEILSRTEATLLSLLVAVAAGLAGAYVTVRRKAAGALPGVAIAVALVPPLAASGILLRLGYRRFAADAVLLFVTNLCSIVLAAAVVFVATGFIHARGRRRGIAIGLALPLVAVIVVTIPLRSHSNAALARGKEEQAFRSAIKSWLADRPMGVQKVAVARKRGYTQAVVDVAGPKRPPDTATLAADLAARLHYRVQVVVRWTVRNEDAAEAVP